jgi:hypothetical protein
LAFRGQPKRFDAKRQRSQGHTAVWQTVALIFHKLNTGKDRHLFQRIEKFFVFLLMWVAQWGFLQGYWRARREKPLVATGRYRRVRRPPD